MGLRSRQKNQGRPFDDECGLAGLKQLNWASFDQVKMAATFVAFKDMQSTDVAGVEDVCAQRKLSQQVAQGSGHSGLFIG